MGTKLDLLQNRTSDLHRYVLAGICVSVLGLLLTISISWHLHRQINANAGLKFEKLGHHAVQETKRRINHMVNGLRGAKGVYVASEEVSRGEFRKYVELRNLPVEFPGTLGFGFVEIVKRGELEAFETAERASGAGEFKVHTAGKTAGQRDDLYVVKFIEPLELNREALGLDLGADAVTRSAIQTAIDTGEAIMSKPLVLIQDPQARTGVIYCLPVYSRDSDPKTIEQRRGAVEGVLIAAIVLETALSDLSEVLAGQIDLEIFEGLQIRSEGLIFDFDGHNRLNADRQAEVDFSNRAFVDFISLEIGGRTWTFAVSTTDAFEAGTDYSSAWIVSGLGLVISLLSGVATYWLGSTRERAISMAKSMMGDLSRLAMVAERTTNAVVVTDAKRKIVWVNEGFVRTTGYTLKEVVGKSPGKILQFEKTDAITVAKLRACLERGEGCRTEILNRSKDGREYYLDLEIQPLRDGKGEITGFIAIESEITEAVHQRQALADQVAKLEEAESLANMGHWSWDISTGRVEWSKQIFTIHRRDPQLGVPDYAGVLSLFEAHSAKILAIAVESALETGDPYHVILRTADEDERYLEAAGNVRRDASGKVASLYGTVRDVTTQVLTSRQLNDALTAAEAATQAKSDFLANMSHEIRTPMTAIIGYTELLAEDGDRTSAPTRRLDYIDTIRRNGEHLLTIINDILDLSKIEAGKMTVECISTDPVQIFHDVLSIMQVKSRDKKIDLKLKCLTDMPVSIMTDPVRFRQILVNLVSNAVKFTDKGGVTVTAELKADEQLEVSVTDTGIGMTEEQLCRLFGAFAQADASTTRKFGGTGLGLRISKMLAKLLGGDIRVTSVPGVGSTFTVTLSTGNLSGVAMIGAKEAMNVVQVSDQVMEKLAVKEQTSTPNAPLQGVRILLAEDGLDNQRLIVFHLSKAGAKVTVADNGKIAFDQLTQESGARLVSDPSFELLLTDMQMPEMDGYTLASKLRGLGSEMPIIALTAHAMSGDAQKCLDAGCDEYTSKPVNRKELIDLCVKHAGRLSNKAGGGPTNKAAA